MNVQRSVYGVLLSILGLGACGETLVEPPLPRSGTSSVHPFMSLATEELGGCAMTNPGSGYSGSGPSNVSCGVLYTIDGWPSGTVLFQGDSVVGRPFGSGSYRPNSFIFSAYPTVGGIMPAVKSVTIRVSMGASIAPLETVRAFDSLGVEIGQADLTGGGVATFAGPITWIQCTNTDNAYVYRISFVPNCFSPTDPLRNEMLESQEVRATFEAAMRRSNADSANLHLRVEVGGWIYKRPDGTYFARIWPDSLGTSTSCRIDLPPPPADPDGLPAGLFHTHPHVPGEDLYPWHAANEPRGCRNNPTGVITKARPDLNGGGSDHDWNASFPNRPMFTIAKHRDGSRRINYLNPSQGNREQNPYRYRQSRADPGACVRPVS